MDRFGERQVRLALPHPYLLFFGIPPLANVHAQVHGHFARAADTYAFDNGARPAAFNVPFGAIPPAAAQFRMPAGLIYLGAGGPIAPGPREDEYAYQYIWAPFAPVEQGTIQPLGKTTHDFALPDMPAGLLKGARTPDDFGVVRFRWRGVTAQAAWNTTVPGTGIAGPYAIDLTNAGAFALPIVPGTVVIYAPVAAGPVYALARDLPWPTAVEARDNVMGRMIGEVDANVDSTINYETGQVAITFNQNVLPPLTNILADFEHDYQKEPMDVRLAFDVNA